jgi:hypothetical protein
MDRQATNGQPLTGDLNPSDDAADLYRVLSRRTAASGRRYVGLTSRFDRDQGSAPGEPRARQPYALRLVNRNSKSGMPVFKHGLRIWHCEAELGPQATVQSNGEGAAPEQRRLSPRRSMSMRPRE